MAAFPAPHADPAEAPIATLGDDVALLAGLTAGAALIHLLMAPGHFQDNASLGVAFLACGLLQAVVALAALRGGGHRWLTAGLAVNALAVLSWLASSTLGLPLLGGVEHGAMGPVAIVGVVDEALAIVLAWAAVRTPLPQRHRALWWTVVALALPAGLGSLTLVSMGDMAHDRGTTSAKGGLPAPSTLRSALCHLV
jgi:hypothetical protein